MEGKPGILVIVILLDVLLLLAAVAFGVLFGIKQTIVFADYNINLYMSFGFAVSFVIASAAIISARNARITADNTYDILRHLELIVKKEGISLSDLALRDQKTAAKIAKKVEVEKQKTAREEEKRLAEEARRQEEEAKLAALQLQAQQEAEKEAAQQEVAQSAEEGGQEEAAPVEEAPAQESQQDVNLGIELKDWKAALEGKVVCGECNSPMGIGKTPGGVFVLFCQGSKKGNGCAQNKAMPVKQFGEQFLEWFEAFYGEIPSYFSLDDFNANVQSVSIKDKVCKFEAKPIE